MENGGGLDGSSIFFWQVLLLGVGMAVRSGVILTYPECIMAEVEPCLALLGPRTHLEVISLDDVEGIAVLPDFLVVPGGSCDAAVVHGPSHRLIQAMDSKGALLAGICNGAVVLASAGVLAGKEVTHTAVPKYAPMPRFKELLAVAEQVFRGSIYVDADVVQSKNVVTAKPHAAQEFAEAVAAALGV